MHSDFFDDLESWSCEQSNDLERTDSNRKEAKNTKLLKPVDVKRTPETKERPLVAEKLKIFGKELHQRNKELEAKRLNSLREICERKFGAVKKDTKQNKADQDLEALTQNNNLYNNLQEENKTDFIPLKRNQDQLVKRHTIKKKPREYQLDYETSKDPGNRQSLHHYEMHVNNESNALLDRKINTVDDINIFSL